MGDARPIYHAKPGPGVRPVYFAKPGPGVMPTYEAAPGRDTLPIYEAKPGPGVTPIYNAQPPGQARQTTPAQDATVLLVLAAIALGVVILPIWLATKIYRNNAKPIGIYLAILFVVGYLGVVALIANAVISPNRASSPAAWTDTRLETGLDEKLLAVLPDYANNQGSVDCPLGTYHPGDVVACTLYVNGAAAATVDLTIEPNDNIKVDNVHAS